MTNTREFYIACEMGIRIRRYESQEARCEHPPSLGGFILGEWFSYALIPLHNEALLHGTYHELGAVNPSVS